MLLFNNRARDGAANRSVGAFADVNRVATCPEQLRKNKRSLLVSF
eukprot:COSAG06_NODE_51516_length_311_cov_1.264151_2_plen_44_part_01